jgi:hypothetical protein
VACDQPIEPGLLSDTGLRFLFQKRSLDRRKISSQRLIATNEVRMSQVPTKHLQRLYHPLPRWNKLQIKSGQTNKSRQNHQSFKCEGFGHHKVSMVLSPCAVEGRV